MTEAGPPSSPPPAPVDPDPLDTAGPDPAFEPARASRPATAAALLTALAFAVTGLFLIVGDRPGGPGTSPGSTATAPRIGGSVSPRPGDSPRVTPSHSAGASSPRPSPSAGTGRHEVRVTWVLRRYPWRARDTALRPEDGTIVRRGTDTGQLVLQQVGTGETPGLEAALDTVDAAFAPGDLQVVTHAALAGHLSPPPPAAPVARRLATRRGAGSTSTYRWERGRPPAEIAARGRFSAVGRLQPIRVATLALVAGDGGRRQAGRAELVGWADPPRGGTVPVFRLSVTFEETSALP